MPELARRQDVLHWTLLSMLEHHAVVTGKVDWVMEEKVRGGCSSVSVVSGDGGGERRKREEEEGK